MNADLSKPLPQMEPQPEGVSKESTESDAEPVGKLQLFRRLKTREGC